MSEPRKSTIIFFDDDAMLMRAFKGFLEPHVYDVHVAPDERSLVSLLEVPVVPSLLLVDYYLLGDRAVAFVEWLKEKFASALSQCHVVGWSSLDVQSAKRLDPRFCAAVTGFAEKPFDERELLALIERYIPRS